MDQNELFTSALGLESPWRVVESELKGQEDGTKVLELELDFEKGAKFRCPKCSESCGVHDTKYLRWRHLQFWQHETILRARVPRVGCEKDGVLQVPVPSMPGTDLRGAVPPAIVRPCARRTRRLQDLARHPDRALGGHLAQALGARLLPPLSKETFFPGVRDATIRAPPRSGLRLRCGGLSRARSRRCVDPRGMPLREPENGHAYDLPGARG